MKPTKDKIFSTPKRAGTAVSHPVHHGGAAPRVVVPCPPHPSDKPLPAEPEDGLMERVAELRAVVSDLSLLSTRIQELEQSEFKALQAEM